MFIVILVSFTSLVDASLKGRFLCCDWLLARARIVSVFCFIFNLPRPHNIVVSRHNFVYQADKLLSSKGLYLTVKLQTKLA